MLATCLLVVLICIAQHVKNATSKVVCEDAKVAQTQLETYYRWWYRCKLTYIILFKKRTYS